MPSFDHEILVELFRRRPELARDLLRGDPALARLLAHGVAELGSIDLSVVEPPEYRCDALVVICGDVEPPEAVVLVEIQRRIDPQKRRTWPSYLTIAGVRHACPVVLLVVAPDPAVASWAGRPIELGHPGFVLRPIVVGVDRIPRVTDPDAARGNPELAVLSALAHPDPEVAEAAVAASFSLADDRARLYCDVILDALPQALRMTLEAKMLKGYVWKTEFNRRIEADLEKRHQEGRQEGRRDALYAAVRKQVAIKFGAVSPEVDARLAAASIAELERYLERIVVVDSVAAVLGD